MSGSDLLASDVARIAQALTAPQRRAVMAGRISAGTFERGPGYWPLKNALIDKRLFAVAGGRDVLTGLGRAVREVLLEPPSAPPARHDTIADSDGDDGA